MIREAMVGVIPGEKGFRWRGGEITRLEGFSDAVFAFAVTLLVVSLEVPKDFRELIETMRGFGAFAVCFALLTNIWTHHYRYFRRYGLQTPLANCLNCILLFFVLFYVYPLKFLFNLAFRGGTRIGAGDARTLFLIYGCGYASVFLVFALLYLHAWRKREELALTPLERNKTRRSLIDHVAMSVIGLTSALLAWLLPLSWVNLAGYFYFVIGLYFTVAGLVFGKRARQLASSA